MVEFLTHVSSLLFTSRQFLSGPGMDEKDMPVGCQHGCAQCLIRSTVTGKTDVNNTGWVHRFDWDLQCLPYSIKSLVKSQQAEFSWWNCKSARTTELTVSISSVSSSLGVCLKDSIASRPEPLEHHVVQMLGVCAACSVPGGLGLLSEYQRGFCLKCRALVAQEYRWAVFFSFFKVMYPIPQQMVMPGISKPHYSDQQFGVEGCGRGAL